MDDDRNRLLGTPFVARTARWGIVAWTAIGILALAFILFRYVLLPIRIIFPPLLLALIFVYVLNPVVTWLQERGIPRILAALMTYIVLLGTVGIVLRYLIPVVTDQVEGLSRALPELVDNAEAWVRDLTERFGRDGAPAGDGGFQIDSQQILDVSGRLLEITVGVIGVAVSILLGLILGFYLLVDLPKMKRGAKALVPARRRAEVMVVTEKLGQAIGGFFRGQLLVALFVGLASTLALYIVGLPYWAIVGMITGLFNLIPLIGPFIGGGIAAFVAFTTSTPGEGLLRLEPGLPLALGAGIGLLIVQQIDNHIISPNIVARTVKLHPVTVMLALLAGGTLLGLWGMLLAVPSVAAVKILILHAWDTKMIWPPPGPAPPETPPVPPPQAEPPPRRPQPTRGRRWGWFRRRRTAPEPEEPREPAKPPRS